MVIPHTAKVIELFSSPFIPQQVGLPLAPLPQGLLQLAPPLLEVLQLELLQLVAPQLGPLPLELLQLALHQRVVLRQEVPRQQALLQRVVPLQGQPRLAHLLGLLLLLHFLASMLVANFWQGPHLL